MFVSAIESAAEFTRPIYTILRYFKSPTSTPGLPHFSSLTTKVGPLPVGTWRSSSAQLTSCRRAIELSKRPDGAVVGFEVSTPGLRGQSGGPTCDTEGRIWGMQASTMHLDLNFDVDMDVVRGDSKKRVKDSAFLHVGHCVHVDILKQFMGDHGVAFEEG